MTTPTREQVSKLFKAALDKRRKMSEESKGDLARWLFSEGMAVARAELEATIAEQAAKIESLRKDDWISVKDRLPDNGTYLCSGHNGIQFICLMRDGEWFRQSAAKRVVGIAHWMPLPAAPKQEK